MTQNAQRETQTLRSKLEANLALLEEKVALASKKLVQMELPVRIKQGSMQVCLEEFLEKTFIYKKTTRYKTILNQHYNFSVLVIYLLKIIYTF